MTASSPRSPRSGWNSPGEQRHLAHLAGMRAGVVDHRRADQFRKCKRRHRTQYSPMCDCDVAGLLSLLPENELTLVPREHCGLASQAHSARLESCSHSFDKQSFLIWTEYWLIPPPAHAASGSGWARENGLDPEYMVHVAHGRPTIETVRTVAPHLDAQAETDQDRSTARSTTWKVCGRFRERKTLLASLPHGTLCHRDLRIATVRNHTAASCRHCQCRSKMITADDVVHGKPDPEPYLPGARLARFRARDLPGLRRLASRHSRRQGRWNDRGWR